MSNLREVARTAGIDSDYTTWRGEPTTASDEAVRQALAALAPELGVDLDQPDAVAALERLRWSEFVPPVVLAWDGTLELPFTVPATLDSEWELEVVTETGARIRAHGKLFELPADSHAWPDGAVHCIRRARVALHELGYHVVTWRAAGGEGEAMVIAAPTKAFEPPGTGARRWGVFAPVYGLASAASGAAGDLANLGKLVAAVGARGGSYVATLPLLAAFLDEPYAFSPYSPASRLYWNELYLDLGVVAAPPFTGTLIDYREQYRWRRPAIDALATRLLADPARAAEIEAWAIGNGAYDYAAFRAIGEAERTGWREWPAHLRDGTRAAKTRGDAIALGGTPARIDSHVVAQWAMQQQLEAIGAGDVKLYLDLPVGVSCDAYEVWRWRQLFLLDLAAGAPPDALFLGGQNWGLPPLSPIAMRRDRYRYFIACVRHHMRVAGMLRVDHVMGLFRLYCIPAGRPATDGVYVRYRADELLAILTLESQRAHCAVAGEDLGTVPDGVRPAMATHGLYRLHVGQWHLPAQIGDAPAPSPPGSVASLNTHDTPTFAGWWRGADIDDKRDLGLVTHEQEIAERAEREHVRAALLAFAGPGSLTDIERAMVAATADLAAGPADVVLVALDDLALDPVPHNVPGTTSERPNWQRRVEGWATALAGSADLGAAAAAITAVVAARS